MEIKIIENEGFFLDGEHIKKLPIEKLRLLFGKAMRTAIKQTEERNRLDAQTALYYTVMQFGKEENGIITWNI